MEYTVKWEIQVEATSPEAAACQALEIQRDVNSTATVFKVIPPSKPLGHVIIDLSAGSEVTYQGQRYQEVPEEAESSCVGCDYRSRLETACVRYTLCNKKGVILKKLSQ